MNAPAAGTRPDVEQLLHLVERAERGTLLPAEAELLRVGITDLSQYREWCGEWSRRHTRLRRIAAQRLRALQRALGRAQRGRLAEVELARLQATLDGARPAPARPSGAAYEQLLAAELLDGWALARAAARLEPVARRTRRGA
ncbi:hypothetical protein [Streptomyces sp. NRRL B-24484]|uniref:hypothetical protein n=1 Tax=Streptomyces sp. NRRL B-24484 TaxID=1463833 RepID=UPI0004BE7F7B|nr:hypothetical protein [Streptomyces sp. NRRL B-24484]